MQEQKVDQQVPIFKLNMSYVLDDDKVMFDYEGGDEHLQQLLDSLDNLNRRKLEERQRKEHHQNQIDVILNIGIMCLMFLGVYLISAVTVTLVNSIGVEHVRK